MSWFTDRLGKGGRSGSTVLAREDDAPTAQFESGAALVMLVPDASGVASYRLHRYADSEAAKAYMEYWFPKVSDSGVIAFWALTDEPAESADIDVEPIVLVRDDSKPGVIYQFSFKDMDSAQAFAREEVEHGVGLDSTLIYWAASVRIETDSWGAIQMSPSAPPTSSHRDSGPIGQISPSGFVDPTTPAILSEPRLETRVATERVAAKKRAAGVLEERAIDEAIPEEFGGTVITNGEDRRDQQRDDEKKAFDLERELQKVLQIKRWEMQTEPFQGLNSPPGRF